MNTTKPKYLRLGKENNLWPQESINVQEPILIHPGEAYCIFVTGDILIEVLKAVEVLREIEGVKFAVFSLAILEPRVLINFNFEKYIKLFTVEEHISVGGLGSLISDFFNDHNINIQLERINIKNSTIKIIGNQDFLRRHSGLDYQSLYNVLKKCLY